MARTKAKAMKAKSAVLEKAKQREGDEGSGDAAEKKKRRFRPGTRALMEIRRIQRNSAKENLIPRAAFNRLVREIGQECSADIKWQGAAIDILQAVAEERVVDLMKQAQIIDCSFAKKTLDINGFRLAKMMMNA